MPDFLEGLQWLGYAFSVVTVAAVLFTLAVVFIRWAYGKKVHSDDVGAPEGHLSFPRHEVDELDRERF